MPPEASVNPLQVIVTAPGLHVEPVKFTLLNCPVNVGTDAPDVRLILRTRVGLPPVASPNLNTLVTDIAADMLDVPVNEKLLTVDIFNTVAPAVVVVVTIDPVLPNAIERVFELVDENVPHVNVLLFKSNDPEVSVTAFAAGVVSAS